MKQIFQFEQQSEKNEFLRVESNFRIRSEKKLHLLVRHLIFC